MTTPCELTAPEREHYEETVRALERRIDEVCAERADLRQMTNEVIDQRDRVQSDRDALADRLAIAERAAREEREARIAAERRLEMLTVGAAARCKCDDDDSWCPCNCCGATTGEPCRHDPKTGLARALSGGKGER